MLDERGRRLAKRHDALAIATLRDAGLSPAEVWEKIDEKIGIDIHVMPLENSTHHEQDPRDA